MKKKIHFLTGTPRSGSTLIANVLAQNPRFHATATSGLLDIINGIRFHFGEIHACIAMPEVEQDRKVMLAMRGVMDYYYGDVENPVVFDKSRGWEGFPELITEITGERPKFICCVRDVRDILASFERLWRATTTTRAHPQEKSTPFKMRSIIGRCESWMANEGVLGCPMIIMRDCALRGFRDCMHFVEYEEFCSKPEKEIEKIYKFIGEEPFYHDFNNVKQVTVENDLIHVYKNLHTIRSAVKPVDSDWPKFIPPALAKNIVQDPVFWRSL